VFCQKGKDKTESKVLKMKDNERECSYHYHRQSIQRLADKCFSNRGSEEGKLISYIQWANEMLTKTSKILNICFTFTLHKCSPGVSKTVKKEANKDICLTSDCLQFMIFFCKSG